MRFSVARRLFLLVLGLLAFASSIARASTLPPSETYARLRPTGTCRVGTFVRRTRAGCMVVWKGGRAGPFHEARLIGTLLIRQARTPMYIARKGEDWFFAVGANLGPSSRAPSVYRNIDGFRYWIAPGPSGSEYVTITAVGWLRLAVVGRVTLFKELPLFVVRDDSDRVVWWGENSAVFGADIASVDPQPDAVYITLRGHPVPLPLFGSQD